MSEAVRTRRATSSPRNCADAPAWQPEDIAAVAVFLAGPWAAYLTGRF